MIEAIKKVLAFAIGGSLMMLVYFNMESEKAALALSSGLSSAEAKAFSACSSHLFGKKMKFTTPYGAVERSRVPDEVCVCQARTMALTFKEDRYGGHQQIVDAIVNRRPLPSLSASDFQDETQSSETVATAVAESLFKCGSDLENAEQEKAQTYRRTQKQGNK
jgi:hypothetical protein